MTREKWERTGRITEWIKIKLWDAVKKERFDPELDRVMICGSEEMTYELKRFLKASGLKRDQQKYKEAL